MYRKIHMIELYRAEREFFEQRKKIGFYRLKICRLQFHGYKIENCCPDYRIDFNNVNILARSDNWRKLLIKETLLIQN